MATRTSAGKRVITTILSVLLLTGALGAGTYLAQQYQSTKTQAAGPQLSLDSTIDSPTVGSSFKVTVNVDTKGVAIGSADIRVRYDTSKLKAEKVETGSALPNVIQKGYIDMTNTDSGRAGIKVQADAVDGVHTFTGTGVLATITFTAKATGSTTITFGSETGLFADGKTTDLTGSKKSLNVKIVNKQQTFYRDEDGDGYGDPKVTVSAAKKPDGYVADGTDCYDQNKNAHPGSNFCGATDRGDGSFDYNCSGKATPCGKDYGFSCESQTYKTFSCSAARVCQKPETQKLYPSKAVACGQSGCGCNSTLTTGVGSCTNGDSRRRDDSPCTFGSTLQACSNIAPAGTQACN